MGKVKVFQKKAKLQGHENKNYGTYWKVLSQAIHMCNMKALSSITSGKKVMANVKFLFTHPMQMRTSELWH